MCTEHFALYRYDRCNTVLHPRNGPEAQTFAVTCVGEHAALFLHENCARSPRLLRRTTCTRILVLALTLNLIGAADG